jgi:hypothetical protein
MNRKMILVLVIGALVLLVCGIFIGGFWMMHQFSSAPTAFSGTQPAYGPGMMGGRGPMMGGQGPFGSSVAPEGYTPPSGGSGGLVAVTADGKTIPAPSDAPKLPENTATQKVGNLNVTLALSPYPPASFQNGNFDITLIDDKGQPITNAKITFDLTMPGMWMPPSKPEAQNIGNGKYHATAFWTMRSLWRIEAIITRGNEKQSAFFAVWL